jgi:dihydrofolate synthase/folylpolyglutamate synthase
MTYRDSLRLLDSLPNYEQLARTEGVFDLERFRRFLSLLGSPQDRLNNVILVAGSKGKGSTCALIDAALRAAGLATGLYTSPHLLDVRERIRVSGESISGPEFARLAGRISPALSQVRVTWFEAMTAIAFLHFATCKLDHTILEVGLGGRLDATNTANPALSVITRIGFDHTEVLGKTLSAIAREKAGVMRDDGPVVAGTQPASALTALRREAAHRRAELMYAPALLTAGDIRVRLSGTSFRLAVEGDAPDARHLIRLGLTGAHQAENALTALAVLSLIGVRDRRVNSTTALRGFRTARLPARFQVVRRDPLLIIDAAHNPDSIRALVRTLREIPGKPLTVIFGTSRDKPARDLLALLRPIAARLVLTQAVSPRAFPLSGLVELARQMALRFETAGTVAQAMQSLRKPAVVTGSFFVAAEALRALRRRS